jgi:hypothetical protein
MSFAWLSPLALAGLALLALPVFAHLTRRTPTERAPFGAMLLVRRMVKRLRRRRQLHDLALLFARCLAAAAAVAAIAAPRLTWTDDRPVARGASRVVVVLDRSMSMSQADGDSTLMERAKDEAAAAIRDMAGAKVGLITYGGSATAVTDGLAEDREAVAERVEAAQVSLEAGDLRGALLEARRMLAGEPGEVLVFTDEAGPAMIPAAQEEIGRLLEQGHAITPRAVHANPPRNLAVTGARFGDGMEGGQVTLRVQSFSPDATEVACEVVLPDGASIPVFVSVEPESEASTTVTVPRKAEGGVGSVRCDDAGMPGDDLRFFHQPSVGASRVLVVDGDPGDTPTRSEVYYLERALAPWGNDAAGVLPEVISPQGLGSLSASTHRVVFLANVGDPRPYAAKLRDFVREGGALVVAVGDNVVASRYNEALGALLPSSLQATASLADLAEEPVYLEPPDTRLALFEPFARGGRGSFRRVGAWRVVTVEPYAESAEVATLLRYEGGAPALVERRIGDGRVILWTSTIDVAWTNLPLQAAFMPLVQRIVGTFGGDASSRAARLDGVPGQPLRVDIATTDEVEVVGPDGGPFPSQVEGRAVVFTPSVVGGYAVRTRGGPVAAWVAVNANPEESDVRRTTSLAASQAKVDPERFERSLDLSPWLWALCGVAILAAAALAWRRADEIPA